MFHRQPILGVERRERLGEGFRGIASCLGNRREHFPSLRHVGLRSHGLQIRDVLLAVVLDANE